MNSIRLHPLRVNTNYGMSVIAMLQQLSAISFELQSEPSLHDERQRSALTIRSHRSGHR